MTIYSKDGLDHLDHEYSPSQHTKRYKTADDAIQGHISLIKKGNFPVCLYDTCILKKILNNLSKL